MMVTNPSSKGSLRILYADVILVVLLISETVRISV